MPSYIRAPPLAVTITSGSLCAVAYSVRRVIFSEPEALIGFAGPRVIKDTTQAKLPEGFQTAEFLLQKGLIDRIIERKNLRSELSSVLDFFKKDAISKGTSKKQASEAGA